MGREALNPQGVGERVSVSDVQLCFLSFFVFKYLEIVHYRFEAWVDWEPQNGENLPLRISVFKVNSVFQAPNQMEKLQEVKIFCIGGVGGGPGVMTQVLIWRWTLLGQERTAPVGEQLKADVV